MPIKKPVTLGDVLLGLKMFIGFNDESIKADKIVSIMSNETSSSGSEPSYSDCYDSESIVTTATNKERHIQALLDLFQSLEHQLQEAKNPQYILSQLSGSLQKIETHIKNFQIINADIADPKQKRRADKQLKTCETTLEMLKKFMQQTPLTKAHTAPNTILNGFNEANKIKIGQIPTTTNTIIPKLTKNGGFSLDNPDTEEPCCNTIFSCTIS